MSYLRVHIFSSILLICLICLGYGTLKAQLVINEICASNDSSLIDQFGNSPDWIELYNNSPEDISLLGLYISDDINKPHKYALPDRVIPSQAFLLIHASNDDTVDIEIHTDFKLSSSGEYVVISDENEDVIDKIYFPALITDQSYGRKTDGEEEWVYFLETSPGQSNNSDDNYATIAVPTSSHESQLCKNAIQVSYSHEDPLATLRYTLDASPVKENSPTYTEPIQVSSATTVRIKGFNALGYSGKELTQVFLFDVDHELPIVHLTTDPDNLYDWEKGIFVKGPDAELEEPYFGANFWKDIEIPIHFDYFVDNKIVRSYDLGAKIHGGKASRSNEMQSLRLLADEEWGDARMNYPFFDESHIRSYKRLVLRNASGDYNYTHFRDGYMARYFAKEKLNLDLLQFQPVVVYINGDYHGLMHIREKIDDDYMTYHYELDKTEYDLLEKDTQIVEGNYDKFNEHYDFVVNQDMSDNTNFSIAETFFDVDHLIDYVCGQSVVNNSDWPKNNIKYWRKKEDGKWRYFLFDMDVSMGRYPWTRVSKDYLGERIDTLEDATFYDILVKLWENEGYQERFVTRYADLLNTSFRSENWADETRNTIEELDKEVHQHILKWANEDRYNWWKDIATLDLLSFSENREDYARKFLQNRFQLQDPIEIKIAIEPLIAGTVKVNTIQPEHFPWTGKYFAEYPVNLTAEENPGYTFSHWEDNLGTNLGSDISIAVTCKDGQEIRAIYTGSFPGMKTQISPMPSREDMLVSFINPEIGEVTLSVYSNKGETIYEVKNMVNYAGYYSTDIRHGISTPGIYYLKIVSGKYSSTKKLIIQ